MKRKGVMQDVKSDTSKPTAIFQASSGRAYTVSVALPGSIITNALTPELKTHLAGRIARALAVFCVDEVVIFDDGQTRPRKDAEYHHHQNADDAFTGFSDPNYFLMHILSYLETPPFLRPLLFPLHPDLRSAGSLPSLDMPHHLKSHEWCQYREGITVEKPTEGGESKKPGKRKREAAQSHGTSLVDLGLPQYISVPAAIPKDTRVTVKLPKDPDISASGDGPVNGLVVAPSAPREEAGYYWGYSVRAASSLSAVITECIFPGGYDLTVGTSERGVPVSDLARHTTVGGQVPQFNHMLVVFGGIAGLEIAVEADSELQRMGVKEPKELFDYWVNLCPGQGSRTIRTDEAVWLGLMGLRDVVVNKGRR
ncbi:MAG: hypothetical protein Q9192_006775 [Flavoplaca navasiana]